MEENKNHIDDYFKSHLSKFDKEPPEEVWNSVINKIDKKRRINSLLIYGSIAAGISVIIGLSWFIRLDNKNKTAIMVTLQSETKKNTKSGLFTKNINNRDLLKTKIITSSVQLNKNRNIPTRVQNSINPYSGNKNNYIQANKINVVTSVIQIHKLKEVVTRDDDNLILISPKSCIPGQRIDQINLPVEQITEKLLANTTIETHNETEENTGIRRWSIQGQLAPLYAYRYLSHAGSNTSISEYNDNEDGIVAYSAMVKVGYKLNNNISFQTGIGYSMLGYTNNDVELMTAISSENPGNVKNAPGKIYLINSSGYGIKYSTAMVNVYDPQGITKINGNFVQELKYIEIPILFRYGFPLRRITFQFTGGLASQLLISTNGYVNDGNSVTNISEPNSFHNINLSSSLGIGINFRLPNQSVLVIEPSYKYFINSVTTNNNSVHPYSFGIYTGLNFNL